MFEYFVTKIIPVCIINSSHKLKGGRPFFANKFGNQIQVWKHAKYLVKQIGPLTPTNFASKNFHHHHHRTIHLTSQKPSTFQVDKIDQTNSTTTTTTTKPKHTIE